MGRLTTEQLNNRITEPKASSEAARKRENYLAKACGGFKVVSFLVFGSLFVWFLFLLFFVDVRLLLFLFGGIIKMYRGAHNF